MPKVVYCKGCRRVLTNYKEVGAAIKERVRLVSYAKAGKVLFTSTSFGPLGSAMKISPKYKIVMDFPQAWKAHTGSRSEALNSAQFPCPNCGKFFRWLTGDEVNGVPTHLFRRWRIPAEPRH
jgi:hypothetical protein